MQRRQAILMKLDDLKKIASRLPYPSKAESQVELHRILRDMGLDPDHLYQELEMTSRYADTHQDTSYGHSVVQLHSHAF